MAITRIGSGTGTTSATLPAHQVGDLILIGAYRDGNNNAPSLPSGYISITSVGANTNSMILGYKLATTTSETSGTWTNATSVIVIVYRGATIGGSNSTTGTGTSISYPTVAMVRANNTSWVAGFGGHRSTNVTIQTAPSGMTNITSVSDATDEMAAHDTNATVSSWTATSASVGGTSSGWASGTVEILDKRSLSLVCSQSSFTLSGQVANLKASKMLINAQGGFILTGQTLTLRATRTLTLSQASYTLTGQSVNLIYAKRLAMAQGSFTLSGQSLNFIRAEVLPMSQASFTLSGQTVNLKKAVSLILSNADFNLYGQSVNFNKGHLLALNKGDFTLNGQTVGLRKNSSLTIGEGVFSASGQTVNLKKASKILGTQQSYTLTGQPMVFVYNSIGAYTLVCHQGAFTLSGQIVGLNYTPATQYPLTCLTKNYSLSGQSLGIYKRNHIDFNQSVFSLTPQSANLLRANRLINSVGSFNLNGQDLTLTANKFKRRYIITS